MPRPYIFGFALLLLAVGAALSPARGESELAERSRRTLEVTRDVMSPYCPGRTLADCPSPDAAALRAEIRGLVDEGVEKEEILSRLRSRYGDAIIGVPRGMLGWLAPALILFAGALWLVVQLSRLSRRRGSEPDTRPARSEEELDRELGL